MADRCPMVIRMPVALRDAVAERAAVEDRSSAALIREALRDYLRRASARERRAS